MRRSDVFHRTVLESEGAGGVRVTDCSLPLRCNAYIEGQRLSGGMRSKGLDMGSYRWEVGVLSGGIQKEWLCIVLSSPHLGI